MPSRYVLDSNGVNLATGQWQDFHTLGSIGSGAGQLAVNAYSGSVERLGRTLSYSGSTWSASVPDAKGGHSEVFTKSGSTFTSTMGDGATLVSSANGYILTLADGTAYTYDYGTRATADGLTVVVRLSEIKAPDGSKTTLTYVSGTYCTNFQDYCSGGKYITKVRLQSVTSSFGYQLHYSYASDSVDTPTKGTNWDHLQGITLSNNAVDGCDPAAPACSYSQGWVTLSGSFDGVGYTDAANRHTSYVYNPTNYSTSITRPTSTSPDTVITRDASGLVTSVAVDGRTWHYNFALSGTTMTAVITNPDNTQRTVVSNTSVGLPTSVTDELNHVTSYSYDTSGRLSSSTAPEGNKVQYTYDARGNVTQTTYVPKAGSPLLSVSTTASYPASCTNAVTCNLPTWTKDAKLHQTDYTYDQTYGSLLTVTAPAAVTNGVRPQTRYTYTPLQAYYKNGSGTLIASGVPMNLLTSTSQCRTQTSCAGTADETKTTIAYGAAGTPNNLQPTSQTVAAGDGSVSATTSVAYSSYGDVSSVDGPLTGTDDTTYYFYDADHEVTGQITADPDGTGALKRRATRLTYNGDGNVTLAEVGTATGIDQTALTNMTVSQALTSTYDASGRKSSDAQSAAGTTFAVTQYSYDSIGRPLCTAVRMNASTWGTVTDACTLQNTSTFGPDRISKTFYDAAGHVIQTRSGFATSIEVADASATYTPNGKVQSAIDANNNTTGYSYDKFDRLATTTYPGGSYEQLGYDSDGNVISRRLRDATSITYGYDNLDRLTSKTLPNSEPATTFGYDLLGHLTGAATTAQTLTLGYDALGRLLTQAGPLGTMTSTFDVGGRRTKLQWADGFYANYDYDLLGEMTAVRENGATSGVGVLASYGYNDLGARTSISRGNGVTTTLGYDPMSRLQTLTHDLASSANDLTRTFAYNPASQITSRAGSNDLYAFNGYAAVSRSYTVNALNQYTSSGGTAIGYDARGNLTSSGSTTYTYTSENLLKTALGATLTFDPAMRLYQLTQGSATTRFGYDGLDLIGEYNGSNTLQRRFVFGAATDEPLVWYEGSTTADRRWLVADERGSVVAVTNAAGAALATDTYDEYGIPGSGNVGRFQYTGQTWLPEIGLYYYKARMYSPTLGRFMQTDPIGYSDGINWYNYVGGDPVNLLDPLGFNTGDIVVTGHRGCSYINADCVSLGDALRLIQSQLKFGEGGGGGGGGNGGGTGAVLQNNQTRHCYGPPKAVAGVSASDLAKQLKTNGNQAASHSAADLGWFYQQVRNKGTWDYKQNGRGYENFGNYNFGYTGTRQGIPGEVLLEGAGIAQLAAGTSSWDFIMSNWDDPNDQEQIRRGISDAQNHCY